MIITNVVTIICIVANVFLLLFIIFAVKNHKTKQENELRKEENDSLVKELVEKDAMLKFISMSPEEIAKCMEIHRFKTVNIYRKLSNPVNFHNQMIQLIEDYLRDEGYSNYMPKEEQEQKKDWLCPVLVIYPSGKKFFYHPIQSENRSLSVSFEISSNSSKDVITHLESLLTLMGEPSE